MPPPAPLAPLEPDVLLVLLNDLSWLDPVPLLPAAALLPPPVPLAPLVELEVLVVLLNDLSWLDWAPLLLIVPALLPPPVPLAPLSVFGLFGTAPWLALFPPVGLFPARLNDFNWFAPVPLF